LIIVPNIITQTNLILMEMEFEMYVIIVKKYITQIKKILIWIIFEMYVIKKMIDILNQIKHFLHYYL